MVDRLSYLVLSVSIADECGSILKRDHDWIHQCRHVVLIARKEGLRTAADKLTPPGAFDGWM